jgi:hypothetical protein
MYIRKGAAPEVWCSVASAQWDNHEDNGYRFTQRGTGNLSNMTVWMWRWTFIWRSGRSG